MWRFPFPRCTCDRSRTSRPRTPRCIRGNYRYKAAGEASRSSCSSRSLSGLPPCRRRKFYRQRVIPLSTVHSRSNIVELPFVKRADHRHRVIVPELGHFVHERATPRDPLHSRLTVLSSNRHNYHVSRKPPFSTVHHSAASSRDGTRHELSQNLLYELSTLRETRKSTCATSVLGVATESNQDQGTRSRGNGCLFGGSGVGGILSRWRILVARWVCGFEPGFTTGCATSPFRDRAVDFIRPCSFSSCSPGTDDDDFKLSPEESISRSRRLLTDARSLCPITRFPREARGQNYKRKKEKKKGKQ